ncbi:MAG: SDR family NAD(P)-dependent oxidoreductase [Pseudomonadota bacterium]
MSHPAFTPQSVAVVTGGASGIGLASAKKFAAMGMRVVIVDRAEGKLSAAAETLEAAGATDIMTASTDVADRTAVEALEKRVADAFGGTDILMNNAGIEPASSITAPLEAWEATIGVNLWGPIHATQLFLPGMLARKRPGAIINTGSKQGITTPPGNTAYNVSKAGLKAFTEALSHELRNTADAHLSAHLLIPGFVHTGLTGRDEKPAAAWTAEQTADFFIEGMNKGDFYILCPDNDVSRPLDEKRIAWAAGDIIENRPALSRWHPDYAEAFAAHIKDS